MQKCFEQLSLTKDRICQINNIVDRNDAIRKKMTGEMSLLQFGGAGLTVGEALGDGEVTLDAAPKKVK